jgi:hypothetical protein
MLEYNGMPALARRVVSLRRTNPAEVGGVSERSNLVLAVKLILRRETFFGETFSDETEAGS